MLSRVGCSLLPYYDETQDETFLHVSQSATVSFCYRPLMLCFMQTKEWRLLCRWGSQKTTRHLITTMENVLALSAVAWSLGWAHLESPSLSSLEFNLIVLWSETENFKNCSDLNIIKSESDWSVDLKSVQVPLSWMMAPQCWFLMTNHEKAFRMLANTVKLFLLPWMRQALPCQMEISYWKSLVSAKIPIQGVYQI